MDRIYYTTLRQSLQQEIEPALVLYESTVLPLNYEGITILLQSSHFPVTVGQYYFLM